jgi:hypothetical protein
LPSPEALQARLAFASANAERAAKEEVDAEQALAKAQRDLVKLEALEPLPPLADGVTLDAPAAAGHRVEVTYRLPRAKWGPAYRVEIEGERATLVELARLEMSGDRWDAVAPTFTTRAASSGVFLRPLAIPQLGVADTVENFSIPRTRHVIVAYGGSKGSESAVDATLNSAKRAQNDDGSWGDGRWRAATTGLKLLTYLGAGYDHRIPSKYKNALSKGIDAAVAMSPESLGLSELALIACALSEAYSMSNDPALKEPAQRDIDALRSRAFGADGVLRALARDGALDGPMAAVSVTLAFKSAKVAGLAPGDELGQMRGLLPMVELCRDRELARIASLFIRVFTGEHQPKVELAEAQRWAARAAGWLDRGQVEKIYLANLVMFQVGGEGWRVFNGSVRDLLVNRQQPDGGWNSPHPGGAEIASAYCQLSLEVYYRYAVVGRGGIALERQADQPIPEPIDAVAATQGWPVRWVASGPVSLAPGSRVELELSRVDLPGKVELSAMPQQHDSVWRKLVTKNPSTQPLPAADALVVVAGEPCGATPVAFTLPGKELVLALGREPAVRVERIAKETSDDGFRSRTLKEDLTYRLVAPPGWTRPVTVLEPMPTPEGGVTLRVPGLDAKALEKRLRDDPVWRLELLPGAEQKLGYEVEYPSAMRAFLEYR